MNKVLELARCENGALTVNALLLIMGLVGLGVAGSSAVDHASGPASVAADQTAFVEHVATRYAGEAEANGEAVEHDRQSVCTPDGRYCAFDHDGDGFVDELRNKARGQSVNVRGNGLTIQGYKDSGWS